MQQYSWALKHYVKWKKAEPKDYILYTSFLRHSNESLTVVIGYRSVVAWSQELLGMQKWTFWDNENILYLDHGGSYKIIYFCQNSWHCAFKRGTFCRLDFSKSDFKNCCDLLCWLQRFCVAQRIRYQNARGPRLGHPCILRKDVSSLVCKGVGSSLEGMSCL